MARKRTAIKRRTGADSYKKIKCMNHDPENSKWGEYAPSLNGCDEIVEVPVETERVLHQHSDVAGPMLNQTKL